MERGVVMCVCVMRCVVVRGEEEEEGNGGGGRWCIFFLLVLRQEAATAPPESVSVPAKRETQQAGTASVRSTTNERWAI